MASYEARANAIAIGTNVLSAVLRVGAAKTLLCAALKSTGEHRILSSVPPPPT